jgi:hypothetical protein
VLHVFNVSELNWECKYYFVVCPSPHTTKGRDYNHLATSHYSRKRMRWACGWTRSVCGREWGLYWEARRTSRSDEFIISKRILYRNDYTNSLDSSFTSWLNSSSTSNESST